MKQGPDPIHSLRHHATAVSPVDRILETAYRLFCDHGITAVGVDRIINESGMAKRTLYRHFGSKDELVLQVLAMREKRWTYEWLVDEVRRRTDEPAEQLLAIFDVFDGWFHQPQFEGCLFINVLLEIGDSANPINEASRVHLVRIRDFIRATASDAGLADAEGFACQWHILMKGSIVAAQEGDLDAALRAQALGRLLLADSQSQHPDPTLPTAESTTQLPAT